MKQSTWLTLWHRHLKLPQTPSKAKSTSYFVNGNAELARSLRNPATAAQSHKELSGLYHQEDKVNDAQVQNIGIEFITAQNTTSTLRYQLLLVDEIV